MIAMAITVGSPFFIGYGLIAMACHGFLCRKDDKLWQILSGLSDDAKVICFANTKRCAVESVAAASVKSLEERYSKRLKTTWDLTD